MKTESGTEGWGVGVSGVFGARGTVWAEALRVLKPRGGLGVYQSGWHRRGEIESTGKPGLAMQFELQVEVGESPLKDCEVPQRSALEHFDSVFTEESGVEMRVTCRGSTEASRERNGAKPGRVAVREEGGRSLR